MARHPVEFNGIFALVAIKPSTNTSIPSTIIVTLTQSKFAKCYKPTVKGAVYEALAAQLDWHTTPSSVSFGLLSVRH
jgi:hypothetical protein